MKKGWFLGIIGIVVMTLISGCSTISGDSKETSVKVSRDKAKELDVELSIGAGKMMISNGADEWVEGSIDYNSNRLKPDVFYKLHGDKGKLNINQSSKNLVNINIGNLKNMWDLQLANDIPINLEVNSGVADTELDLTGLRLSNLTINAGVGDVYVDLSGDWKESFDVSLKTGMGEASMILPKDVGVKIISTNGIGTAEFDGFIPMGDGVYVNDAYEISDIQINIETEMGIGEVTFTLDNK